MQIKKCTGRIYFVNLLEISKNNKFNNNNLGIYSVIIYFIVYLMI